MGPERDQDKGFLGLRKGTNAGGAGYAGACVLSQSKVDMNQALARKQVYRVINMSCRDDRADH